MNIINSAMHNCDEIMFGPGAMGKLEEYLNESREEEVEIRGDFSAFDRTISHEIVHIAADILESLIDFNLMDLEADLGQIKLTDAKAE